MSEPSRRSSRRRPSSSRSSSGSSIGQASLDEALALWERGEELYAFCREQLDAAQGKVEELARRVEQSRPEPQA